VAPLGEIAQFRDSNGTIRTSISFITEALGMPHATVSRGLKLLKDSTLIQLVETNFKLGNLWRITPRAAWHPPGGGK
jgi:DNA-binding IclR family transcriptional regulator